MAEYITRNNAISAVCFGCNQEFSDEPCEPDTCAIRQAIMALPTADVVEVVRCKDCKYRKTPDCKMWYHCVICGDYHHWERDEYYCSYGERKEEE